MASEMFSGVVMVDIVRYNTERRQTTGRVWIARVLLRSVVERFNRANHLMAMSTGPHPPSYNAKLPGVDDAPIVTPAPRALPAIAIAAGQLAKCRPLVRMLPSVAHGFRPCAKSFRLGLAAGSVRFCALLGAASCSLSPRIDMATDA
jgi:hypothetical protein